MGLDTTKIKNWSAEMSTDSMAMAAQEMPNASDEEVREAITEVVAAMLEERWALVRWIIGDKWTAKLVAKIVDVVGKVLLSWLR